MTDTLNKPLWKWRWLLLLIMICVYLALAYMIPPGADTLWRLHMAEGVLDGQTLYRDIVEVNPPLWFWGAVPAALLGGYSALVAINLFVTFIGVALFGALARLTLDIKGQWAAILGLACGLLLVNVAEVGQREQAFLLACALWSGLAAARIEQKTVPIWLALMATIFSAYGFALKHYFILVPFAIEALIIWHKRRTWQPLRPETLLMAVLAGMYALAVVYLTPDFLGRVLGLVQVSYHGFGPWNAVGPVERQVRLVMQCIFILVPISALVATRHKTTLERVLLVALSVSVVIILLQQKGWRYHLIAANGLSILIMVLIWQGGFATTSARLVKRFVPLGLAALVWTAVVQPAVSSLKTDGQPMDKILGDIVANEAPNHHIAILSTAPDNAFFPLARAGRRHWSRHYSMWMMPGLLTPQSNAKKEAQRLSQRALVLSEFIGDITCNPPDLIIGEVGYFRNPAPKLFDAMAFLTNDPGFSVWIDTNYHRQATVGNYPIWRLRGAKPVPKNCVKSR